MTGTWRSPIGLLEIEARDGAIVRIAPGERELPFPEECPVLEQCREELIRYFAGKLREFNVPVHPEGTEFQQKIWRELRKIPYGQTLSYGDVALRASGSKRFARAAANAAHKNPILLVIPCHRMIGGDGAPGGFSAGEKIKQYLLELEGSCERK